MRRSWGTGVHAAVLVAAVLLYSGQAWADARLSTQVVPTFEAITLKIDADRPDYTGTAQFELEVKEQTSTFNFHAEGMTIDKLTLTRGGQPVPAEFTMQEYGIVQVSAGSALAPGPAQLVVTFSNTLDTTDNSLHRVEDGGFYYTFTQFEPDDAREAFPCWDEPAFKIPFQITLIVPEAHTAVSNSPVESESVADGWKTVIFQRSKPLPTYLVAFATGPLESVPIPGMSVPGNVWTPKGKTHLAGEAVKITPLILAALEKYFGESYPYEKCDMIAVPGQGGAMENPGLITYGDGLILLDPETMSPSQRRTLAAVHTHELAHIWFGDLVTLEWWDETWLNESFASWMGDKITHEVFPELGMDVSAIRSGLYAMNTDARPSTRAIRRPVEATDNLSMSFDDLAYSKGQAVLGMFEQWVGPEALREAVLEYCDTYAWRTTTAHDFWTILSRISGQDIEAAMSTYLDQPGVALVSAEVTLDNRVKLTQKRFSNYGVPVPEDALWQIPVVLKYSDGIDTRTQTVLLTEPEKTVELHSLEGDPAWVLPNAGMHGYYRWSVPPAMLARLAEGATEELEVTERVGLISNLGAELDAGSISGDNYLLTLNHFANDPDPEVISALLSAVGKIRQAFVVDENENDFALWVRGTLGPALKQFGFTRKEGEEETITRFRSQLLGWLGEEGMDKRVQAYADSLSQVYLKEPTAVDPQLAGICLYLTALRGDRALFDEFKRRFEAAEIPRDRSRFLGLLGDFRDPELVEDALTYSLDGPLRPLEIFSIPGSILGARQYEERIYVWLTTNYDAITSRIPPQYAAYMPSIGGGCSLERLARTRVFFAMPTHNVPGTDEIMAKVADRATDCAGLRERETAAVNRYLKEFAATE
ncbi:MAG TPA: M1 family metallopeptidase [Acidobacteriota bacterium]|nr:M1 family metallopeptidase [Acidobacteriota bacterium]